MARLTPTYSAVWRLENPAERIARTRSRSTGIFPLPRARGGPTLATISASSACVSIGADTAQRRFKLGALAVPTRCHFGAEWVRGRCEVLPVRCSARADTKRFPGGARRTCLTRLTCLSERLRTVFRKDGGMDEPLRRGNSHGVGVQRPHRPPSDLAFRVPPVSKRLWDKVVRARFTPAFCL